ncbi:hypothetical protein F4811DRAFT_553652 [Daldinia bambusicola]|nr:hypothetical protein F4811DRAFT_553652 [Daldinia bambusicola]
MLTNRRSTLMIPSNGTNRAKPDSEPHCTAPSILTSTLPTLPGYRVARVLGAVYGCTTYAVKEAKALLKAAAAAGVGGEVRSLTHVAYNARDQAVERMARDCVARGANAVVGLQFVEMEVLGFVQVAATGTAVYVEKEGERERGRDRETLLEKEKENPFS